MKELGFSAVKVHPNAQRIDVTDAEESQRLKSYLEDIGKVGAFAIVHAYGKSLEFQRRLYNISAQVPGTKIVLAHMFGEYASTLAAEIAKNEPRPSHIYFDLSGSVIEQKDSALFAKTIRAMGLDRVVFGSDFSVYSPLATADAVRKLPLSIEEIAKVFSNRGPIEILDRTRTR